MDDSAKLAQFIDVTGASQEAAKFFLESSGGQVDTAVDQYFATGGAFEAPEGIGVQQTPLAPDYHQAEGARSILNRGTKYAMPLRSTVVGKVRASDCCEHALLQ